MSEWYCQIVGDVVGPISFDELRQKAAAGEIDRDTPVREGSGGQWVAASQAEGLFDSPGSGVQVDTADELPSATDPAPDTGAFGNKDSAMRRSPLSMRPCSDCGKMVSRQAHACPFCGRMFHESSLVVRYKGEHPVPVLIFFSVLAVLFVLISPIAVYALAEAVATRVMPNSEAATSLAVVVAACYVVSMIVSAILGGAVGKPRMAYVTGLFLGLFFGPLGVFTAFAMDKRPQCCHCSSRLDGLARECPYCHARLLWKVESTWY